MLAHKPTRCGESKAIFAIKQSRRIHITLNKKLLVKLDQAASESTVMRSEYIRSAVIEKLAKETRRHAKLQGVVEHYDPKNEDELLRLFNVKRLYRNTMQRKLIWKRNR